MSTEHEAKKPVTVDDAKSMFWPPMQIPTHLSIEMVIRLLRELPRFNSRRAKVGLLIADELTPDPEGNLIDAETIEDLIARLEALRSHDSPENDRG